MMRMKLLLSQRTKSIQAKAMESGSTCYALEPETVRAPGCANTGEGSIPISRVSLVPCPWTNTCSRGYQIVRKYISQGWLFRHPTDTLDGGRLHGISSVEQEKHDNVPRSTAVDDSTCTTVNTSTHMEVEGRRIRNKKYYTKRRGGQTTCCSCLSSSRRRQ